MLRRGLISISTLSLLGCTPAKEGPPTHEPEVEHAGSEPVASSSLTGDGRIGRDPDAPDPPPAVPPGPLARFSGEPIAQVVEPDGLVITDYEPGLGSEARAGDVVRLHYIGTLLDGREFDSTHARNDPFSFELGSGRVIPGLDRGLIGARVGMLRVLSIPPALGYGERDLGGIPPHSTLVFYVEVLGIESPVDLD